MLNFIQMIRLKMIQTGQKLFFIPSKKNKMQMNSNNKNAGKTGKNTSKNLFLHNKKTRWKLNIHRFIW